MNDFVGAVIGFISAIGAVGAWKIAVKVFIDFTDGAVNVNFNPGIL